MGKEIFTFGNIEIEKKKKKKKKIDCNKTAIIIKNVHNEKVLVPNKNKTSFGEKNCKYFIG